MFHDWPLLEMSESDWLWSWYQDNPSCNLPGAESPQSPGKQGRFRLPARTASCSALLKRRGSNFRLLERKRSKNILEVDMPQVNLWRRIFGTKSFFFKEHLNIITPLSSSISPPIQSVPLTTNSSMSNVNMTPKPNMITPTITFLSPVISQVSSPSSPPIRVENHHPQPIRIENHQPIRSASSQYLQSTKPNDSNDTEIQQRRPSTETVIQKVNTM